MQPTLTLPGFQGQVAVVTGGCSGIGAGAANILSEQGASVVVWDVNEAADIRCDISVEAQVESALADTRRRWGTPSLFVAAAGIGANRRLLDLDLDLWNRTIDVNLRGTFVCLREAAKAMVEVGQGGAIVAVSSVNSHVIDPGMGAYTASKAGLNALVRVAAREWGQYGIRVNSVCPGATLTAMSAGLVDQPGALDEINARTPLGRIGQPGDVAQAIVAVLGMQWVTGQVIDADGGFALVSPRRERDPFAGRGQA